MTIGQAKQATGYERHVVVVNDHGQTGLAGLDVAEDEDWDEGHSCHTQDGQPPAVFTRLQQTDTT